VAAAMREVGEYLGNTATIARNSYVDPAVIDAYEEGRTIRLSDDPAALERATLRLLRG
jgi:DNA topoisomerase I